MDRPSWVWNLLSLLFLGFFFFFLLLYKGGYFFLSLAREQSTPSPVQIVKALQAKS